MRRSRPKAEPRNPRGRRHGYSPAGSRPTKRAPDNYFTGTVWQDPIIAAVAPARLVVFRVTFEPGARTAWHSHPLGQTLYVVSGIGRVQTASGPVREIKPGDTVWIPPGEKHWHGASPENSMCHIAMQEAQDGNTAAWMEMVSDEEYNINQIIRLIISCYA